MKKILCLLLVLLALAVPLSVSAAANPVTDKADLLTDEQEYELIHLLGEQGANTLAVVALDSLNGEDIEDYAEEFAETAGIGVVFVISMAERKWCITAAAEYKSVIDAYVIDEISAQCVPYLKSGDYYGAFETFANCCNSYLEGFVPGQSDPLHGNSGNSGGSVGGFGRFLICLLIGLAAGGITAGIMAGKNKSVRPQTSAANYVRGDSMRVSVSRDTFLYHTVTRTPKPKNTGSSGGGSGGRSTRSGSF